MPTSNSTCPTHTFLWLTIFKMCFGFVCFALFTDNFHDDAILCPPKGESRRENGRNNMGSTFCGCDSDFSICFVRRQFTVVACVAFTFVIEPALIVAYMIDRPKQPETTLACLLCGTGFLAYLVGGSSILYVIINYYYWNYKPSAIIAGLFFILTAVAYAYHFLFMLYKHYKRRAANADVSNRPPVPNAPPREMLYSEILTPMVTTRT